MTLRMEIETRGLINWTFYCRLSVLPSVLATFGGFLTVLIRMAEVGELFQLKLGIGLQSCSLFYFAAENTQREIQTYVRTPSKLQKVVHVRLDYKLHLSPITVEQ